MSLDLETLSPSPGSRKNRKRVGRGPGSGTGKTSGRGHKGQKSRSGYSRRQGFEGGQMSLIRRLPKRGFRHQTRHPTAEINVDALELSFDSGAEVTAEVLIRKGLIKAKPGGVKILGRGDINKKLTVKVAAVSAGAREKIEKAGGSIEIIAAPEARAKKLRGTRKSQGK